MDKKDKIEFVSASGVPITTSMLDELIEDAEVPKWNPEGTWGEVVYSLPEPENTEAMTVKLSPEMKKKIKNQSKKMSISSGEFMFYPHTRG